MARPLILRWLPAVLVVHWLLLDTLLSWAPRPTSLRLMTQPFFTRELLPSTAPVPVPSPPSDPPPSKPVRPAKSRSLAIESDVAQTAAPSVAEPGTSTLPSAHGADTLVAANSGTDPGTQASGDTRDAAPPADLPASEQASASRPGQASDITALSTGIVDHSVLGPSTRAPADSWPADTRLSYQLSGYYRGAIGGEGRVQWQRQGQAYQVRVELDLSGVTIFTMTSQGEVRPEGLQPAIYEEKRLGAKPLQVLMDSSGVRLNDGRRVNPTTEAQDTASQFVELGHRFMTGKASLQVGQRVNLWLARPNALAEWTYDVVALDTLAHERLGAIEAYHLKPRPLENPSGPVTAEMWFAPRLQYLPVRIKITLNSDTWVDLKLDKVEQATAQTGPPVPAARASEGTGAPPSP